MSWSQMVMQVRQWSAGRRFAVLSTAVLTSTSDWLSAMEMGYIHLPPGLFDGCRPTLQTPKGQPVDRMAAYMLLGSEIVDATSANICEINSEPLMILAANVATPSLPSQSRQSWQQAVETLLGA